MNTGFISNGQVFIMVFEKHQWPEAIALLQMIEVTDEAGRRMLLETIEKLSGTPKPPDLRLV